MSKILTLIFAIAFLAMTVGCPPKQQVSTQGQGTPGAGQNAIDNASASDQYRGAERLAKRVVIYKVAAQEGDLAPFTATVDNVNAATFPEIVKQANKYWWSVDWPGTSLKPLPISELTLLETDIFPLINARMEQADDTNKWILFTLGYDPDSIKPLIANAHSDWIPEERELYLSGSEPGCIQVWVGKVDEEWKILANIACPREVTSPEPPVSTAPVPPSQQSGTISTGSTGQGEPAVTH